MLQFLQRPVLLGLGLAMAALSSAPKCAAAADAVVPFEGEKSSWHDGFDLYDYMMDEESLNIQPFKRDANENFAVNNPPQGKRRCVVIVPRRPALGNPWSWRGCYWDHQPQVEVELLKRGFHVAYISANATLKPGKQWDAWYAFLTTKHGLSKKPAFVGMSRGGEYSYIWATTNPDKVSCIYADNPGVNLDVLKKLSDLAAADVPILHVCGSIDPLLGRSATTIENIYHQFGGRISVMIKEGSGHHPHSLRDPKPIADFISQSVQPVGRTAPKFLGERTSRMSFYGIENSYRYFSNEGNYLTCRGPWFTACYDRYTFNRSGVEGAITVLVPKTTAPGNPWVFRADGVTREAVVDLGLLAKGFHIVTGPVPYNADGPSLQSWNAVYKLLTESGLSKKLVLEGAGGAAGEAYAWAIANPDKVSCIYAENPVLRCTMTRAQPLDNLSPLAKASVPLLHVCGSLDPMFKDHTRAAERRYKELGASITVLVQEGGGHYPTAPRDPKPVIDFILGHQEAHATRPKATPREGSQSNAINGVGLKSGPSSATRVAQTPVERIRGLTREQIIEQTMKPFRGLSEKGVDCSTLKGKVLCGYQGWHAAEGDDCGRGWYHWTGRNGFKPGSTNVDLWPDVSELDPDERYATPFKTADGKAAEVYSAFNARTAIRHFQWMHDYGIDGVFVQRFAGEVFKPLGLRQFNTVLDHCREGANKYGRTYAVMYDLSGISAGQMGKVIEDWKLLTEKMRITKDPAYLHHNGKPVVAVWGFGFNDRRRYTLKEGLELVAFLKSKEGGDTMVLLGVPTYWRTLERDAVKDKTLLELVLKADIVSPWTVGRYNTPEQAANYAKKTMAPDIAWCEQNGKDYLPVVFPGFSRHNQNRRSAVNSIPRQGGKFLWSQFAAAKKAGATMVYQAMFDEVDEGTAIYKCTNNVPVGETEFLTFEGLPSDFYLKLVGAATKMIRGDNPLTDEMPMLETPEQ
jgi:pimeloyl-ACP methyl ester carboxylesterase